MLRADLGELTHLCCPQRWSPGYSRVSASRSDRSRLRGTKSALRARRRSSPPLLHRATCPSTPRQNVLCRCSPEGWWFWRWSFGRAEADLKGKRSVIVLKQKFGLSKSLICQFFVYTVYIYWVIYCIFGQLRPNLILMKLNIISKRSGQGQEHEYLSCVRLNKRMKVSKGRYCTNYRRANLEQSRAITAYHYVRLCQLLPTNPLTVATPKCVFKNIYSGPESFSSCFLLKLWAREKKTQNMSNRDALVINY